MEGFEPTGVQPSLVERVTARLHPPEPWIRQEGPGFLIHVDGAADERWLFARAVARGLESAPRRLDCRWLYDSEGSRLFEAITGTPEYYPTRVEDRILAERAAELRARAGDTTLVELGSGSSSKTRRLLDAWLRSGPTRYVPIDVSASALCAACARLANHASGRLAVEAIAAPFERALPLLSELSPLCLLFLGSSLGNFQRDQAERFLSVVAAHLHPGDAFVVGLDLVKDAHVLEAAYNDAAGHSAAFTRNLFARMNRELGARIPLDAVEHIAFWDSRLERVEIHARFRRSVQIELPLLGRSFHIGGGEMVCTEIACKYRRAAFEAQAARAGFALDAWHTDAEGLCAVALLKRKVAPRSTRATERARTEAELGRIRQRTLDLIAPLDEAELRIQPDPLMGPLLWDLGHIAAYEDLWLLRRPDGADEPEAQLPPLFDPLRYPRPSRGQLVLPALDELLGSLAQTRAEVLARLRGPQCEDARTRSLLRDDHVYHLVAQHEAQHQETMLAALQLRPGLFYQPAFSDTAPRPPKPRPDEALMRVPAGFCFIGTDDRVVAWDNERPRHEVDLPAFAIDCTPVTNEAYLAFMRDGGYRRPEFWSAEGRRWLAQSRVRAPLFWERTGETWVLRRFGRLLPLDPDEPVMHVSWFEADAFARWRGARLPTEEEWEKAAAWDEEQGMARRFPWGDELPRAEHANLDQQRLGPTPIGAYPEGRSACGCHQMIGDVWEWTASWFQPWPGFEVFPYKEYSAAWFGTRCRVLRGGSWATDRAAIRCTFRNWDLPERRQIFAGFRCAKDE